MQLAERVSDHHHVSRIDCFAKSREIAFLGRSAGLESSGEVKYEIRGLTKQERRLVDIKATLRTGLRHGKFNRNHLPLHYSLPNDEANTPCKVGVKILLIGPLGSSDANSCTRGHAPNPTHPKKNAPAVAPARAINTQQGVSK